MLDLNFKPNNLCKLKTNLYVKISDSLDAGAADGFVFKYIDMDDYKGLCHGIRYPLLRTISRHIAFKNRKRDVNGIRYGITKSFSILIPIK